MRGRPQPRVGVVRDGVSRHAHAALVHGLEVLLAGQLVLPLPLEAHYLVPLPRADLQPREQSV